jgi:hypothetical protein
MDEYNLIRQKRGILGDNRDMKEGKRIYMKSML